MNPVVPVLVTCSHFGPVLAPDCIANYSQRDGSFVSTTGELLDAYWCSHDLLNCVNGYGPCPIDECTNLWVVYAWAGTTCTIQGTPGIPIDYSAYDVWLHNEQGRWAGPADHNLDGFVNSQDMFAFLAHFFEGNADHDLDGVTTSTDYFMFMEDLLAGE